jgi:hypothetical protein
LARTAAEPSLEISSAAASRLRLLRSLAQRNSGLGKRTATCEAGGDAQADDDRASDGELLGPARKLIRPAIPCAPADQRRRPEVGTTTGIGDLKRRNERRCAARGNPRPIPRPRPSAGGGNFVPSVVVVARDPPTHPLTRPHLPALVPENSLSIHLVGAREQVWAHNTPLRNYRTILVSIPCRRRQ